MPIPLKDKLPGKKKPGDEKPKPEVRHKHEPKEHAEHDCTQCEYATLADDGVWECYAEVYYPRTKICFKPRKK